MSVINRSGLDLNHGPLWGRLRYANRLLVETHQFWLEWTGESPCDRAPGGRGAGISAALARFGPDWKGRWHCGMIVAA